MLKGIDISHHQGIAGNVDCNVAYRDFGAGGISVHGELAGDAGRRRRLIMTNQQISEIVKALAYGETAAQAATAEGIPAADVQKIAIGHLSEIGAEKELLKKAGYING